jgi:hypothetical protein
MQTSCNVSTAATATATATSAAAAAACLLRRVRVQVRVHAHGVSAVKVCLVGVARVWVDIRDYTRVLESLDEFAQSGQRVPLPLCQLLVPASTVTVTVTVTVSVSMTGW